MQPKEGEQVTSRIFKIVEKRTGQSLCTHIRHVWPTYQTDDKESNLIFRSSSCNKNILQTIFSGYTVLHCNRYYTF